MWGEDGCGGRVGDNGGGSEKVRNSSLVPSCPRPLAENVWWFDLNLLSPTPSSSGPGM